MSSYHTPSPDGGQGFSARQQYDSNSPEATPAALKTALRLLDKQLWPIPITAPDDPGPAAGKRPIGEQWGAVRHTEASLRALWRAHPKAGVGVKLGKDGGVIDVEIDDRESGPASLALLFGDRDIPTLGWESTRGSHRLFRWDDRLGRYGRTILKAAQLPGLEIRVGAAEAGGKQLQSVVPPSPGSDGVKRKWNGCGEIAAIPESFFVFFDPILLPTEGEAPRTIPIWTPPGVGSVPKRARAYLDRMPDAIEGQRGHDRIYHAACVLVDGFALPYAEALAILKDWNSYKANPPESDRQIEHKLTDAMKNTPRSGSLLNADRPGFAYQPRTRVPLDSGTGDPGADPAVREIPTTERLGIMEIASVASHPVDWLWKYRFARGGLSLMAGDGGVGKSQVLLWIAAAVSTGAEFPDGSGSAPVGNVVLVSAEDRPEDTIKPRLTAMGADMGRISICKSRLIVPAEGRRPLVVPQSFQDLEYWHEVFNYLPETMLLIVDPLPSYLGRGVDDAKNIDVRNVMEPFLEEIIAPRNICMIGNTHLNKSSGARSPMARVTGSMAYVNLARNVHFVVRDPDDPARRYFQQGKCNNAPVDLPAMAFRVESRLIEDGDREPIETAVPVFEADTQAIDLDSLMGDGKKGGGSGKPGPDVGKRRKVAEWLHDLLKDHGATPLAAVFDTAGDAGLVSRDKNGRWSVGSLYNARDFVPELDEPRDGMCVKEAKLPLRGEGRKVVHWYLALDDGQAPD